MTEAEALAYLSAAGRFGELGLARTERLLAALDTPQRDLRFYHVAGTNGKGSTIASIDAALRRLGRRTGRFISPHLIRPHERIAINGKEIGGEALARHAAAVREACTGMADPPTEFELWTGVGLLYFRAEGVTDVAWETGLGGRYDATNVVAPEVSVITSIGYDHMDRLGGTLAAIAWEKAGILKAGRPAVVGALPPEAMVVIEADAAEKGSPLWRLGQEISLSSIAVGPDGTRFTYRDPLGELPVRTALIGRHQAGNAALAVAALRRTLGAEAGEAAASALGEARWPGRFEVRAGDPAIVLDGAHNPEGALALRDTWREVFSGVRAVALFGCLSDRDPLSVAGPVLSEIAALHAVAPPSPRALPAQEAARALSGTAHEDVSQGLRAATADARRRGVPLLVFGSLYLIGAVEALLYPSP